MAYGQLAYTVCYVQWRLNLYKKDKLRTKKSKNSQIYLLTSSIFSFYNIEYMDIMYL